MSCEQPKPIYVSHAKEGISGAVTRGDGYTIGIEWTQAYPDTNPYQVMYNIYYSTLLKDVFAEGVKSVSIDPNVFTTEFYELTPGDTYYFAVRASEYDLAMYDPSLLPDGFPGLKLYPETILTSPITDTSNQIPISDINEFPPMGVVQIGLELIRYSSKDVLNSLLLIADINNDRGFLNTKVRSHDVDGYDGYAFQDPFVRFWKGFEEENTVIHQATSKFAYPNFPYTLTDGYREILKDPINTDLSADYALQIGFQPYDYVGWHRTDPEQLFAGDCIGTYYGGEQFCADGYGVGFQLRGVPFNEVNDQRQEVLLDLEGDPCCLLRRRTTGITCSCYEPATQNPGLRCPNCYGTGFVTGYEQYFFPRRSDGRIMVKFDPTEEDIKIEDEGLEGYFLPNCWTLTVPPLKSRDVLIRFNEDGTEEFRYKVLRVTRNRLLSSISGAQKFSAVRVRRTDPIYQWRAFRNTAMFPQTITTGIGILRGPGNVPIPHTHDLVINENILVSGQINETSSVARGHNHEIRNGVVMPALGHTHPLIYP